MTIYRAFSNIKCFKDILFFINMSTLFEQKSHLPIKNYIMLYLYLRIFSLISMSKFKIEKKTTERQFYKIYLN